MAKLKADDEKLSELIGEDGYFVVNKKSIRWALGILSFVLVTLWGSLQYSINESNTKNDKTNASLTTLGKSLTTLVNKLEEDKVDPLKDYVIEMKGDVKVLLDRTNSRAGNTNSNGEIPNSSSAPPPHFGE